jgi:hypothetical protein
MTLKWLIYKGTTCFFGRSEKITKFGIEEEWLEVVLFVRNGISQSQSTAVHQVAPPDAEWAAMAVVECLAG